MKSLLFLAVLLAQDADSRKSAQQLFTEGQRFESVNRDYSKAAEKYKKAAEKTAGDKTLLARALHNLARCCENMEPENISGALEAWNRIVSECGDVEPYAGTARKKVEWQGVDVWLRQYKAALEKWRETRRTTAALTDAREAVWTKIQALETKAVPGLLGGLSSDDEVLRAFAADSLAQLTDGDGISKIVEKLKDADPVARGGASLALEKVFDVWSQAKVLDDQAAAMREDFDLAKLGASEKSDVDAEIENAERAAQEAQKALDKAKADEAAASGPNKEVAKSRREVADNRLQQAKDHVKVLRNVKLAHERAADLEARATKVRRNIPKKLNTPAVESALADVIKDETAPPTARLEAAKAAQAIGEISGALAEAIMTGMKSKNRNVRVGCVRAAAAVSTATGEDKHRFVDVLMDIVQYEPEKQWNPPTVSAEEEKAIRETVGRLMSVKAEEFEGVLRDLLDKLGDKAEDEVRRVAAHSSGKTRERLAHVLLELKERRWANDGLVRQAAAQALGKIALVKSVPALLEALEDNDTGVRGEANDSLILLTRMNFGFESEPRISDPEHKLDDAAKRAAQAKLRQEAIKRWKEWWATKGGVDIVVERFWTFQQRWSSFDAADLFDKEFFLRKVLSTSTPVSRKWDEERALRIHQNFQRDKDVLVMDVVDLGESAMDRLFERLDGKSDQETVFAKVGKDNQDRLVAKSRAATRKFVAECIAKSAVKTGATSTVATRLVGDLGGERGAGAATALGLLGKGTGDAARGALETSGLGAGDEATREAAALALRLLGAESSAKGLTDLAVAAAPEVSNDAPRVRTAIAALRALAALKLKNPETVRALGALVGQESEEASTASTRASSDLVREFACEALGEFGDAAAAVPLLRARRDTKRNVRDAAAKAIQMIFKGDASIARKLLEVLRDEKASSLDRMGAALGIGDTGHEPAVHALVARLLDPNPPTLLRDPDPAVRAALCRALAAIKSRTQLAIGKLIEALRDPAEEVRQEAYLALRETVGVKVAERHTIDVLEISGGNPEPHEFKGWYESAVRARFLALWENWFKEKKGEFKEEPAKEL